jgi:hypothetical protein
LAQDIVYAHSATRMLGVDLVACPLPTLPQWGVRVARTCSQGLGHFSGVSRHYVTIMHKEGGMGLTYREIETLGRIVSGFWGTRYLLLR